MKKQKTFILDTSVLLYDCHSIHTLSGHKVIIPIVVLDELDRFKDKQSLIGENARYINRYLDGLRSKGNIEVNKIASKYFNGGGHINASGGISYESVNDTIIKLENIFKTNF